MKATVEQIEQHMSPERPLREDVREFWMHVNRARFETDAEAEAGFDEHWNRVQDFFNRLAKTADVYFV